MPAIDIGQRRQETCLDPGLLPLQVREEVLDPGPFQVLVPADRTGAAGYGKTRQGGESDDVVLGNVNERPDNDVPSVIGPEQRRHGLDPAVVKLVQKEGFNKIIPVMAESYLGAAQIPRLGVEHAALDPCA